MTLNRNFSFKLIAFVVLILATATVVVGKATNNKEPTQQQKLATSPTADQAKITWSTTAINIDVSPGSIVTRNLTFASSLTLNNITIEAVPEIAHFLTINPAAIASVPGNELQAVVITFSVDPATPLGSYQGTVHVRNSNQTFPQTLKLTINVVLATFNSPELGFQIVYPIGSTIVPDGSTISFFDPSFPDLPPTFDIQVFTPSVDSSKPLPDILKDIATQRLGEDFQEVISSSGNGLLVKAGTIYGQHFFIYDVSKNRAAEIRGGSPDFFSMPLFQYVRDSLVFF
jgi:hypothetical protein